MLRHGRHSYGKSFVPPVNMKDGWGDTLLDLEIVVVTACFTREEMMEYCNGTKWVDTIQYPQEGTVLFADQREERKRESVGWQSVWRFENREAFVPSAVWVHPAILSRLCGSVCAAAFDRMRGCTPIEYPVPGSLRFTINEEVPDLIHVDVTSMDGRIPDIWEHCGTCFRVLFEKRWPLIRRVMEGVAELYAADPTVVILCFVCDHGKHRSVAARTFLSLLCPRVNVRRHPRRWGGDWCQCWQGCMVASAEDVRRMLRGMWKVEDALSKEPKYYRV